jgi:hypothetical protein
MYLCTKCNRLVDFSYPVRPGGKKLMCDMDAVNLVSGS